jgi:hypothetical protein
MLGAGVTRLAWLFHVGPTALVQPFTAQPELILRCVDGERKTLLKIKLYYLLKMVLNGRS